MLIFLQSNFSLIESLPQLAYANSYAADCQWSLEFCVYKAWIQYFSAGFVYKICILYFSTRFLCKKFRPVHTSVIFTAFLDTQASVSLCERYIITKSKILPWSLPIFVYAKYSIFSAVSCVCVISKNIPYSYHFSSKFAQRKLKCAKMKPKKKVQENTWSAKR